MKLDVPKPLTAVVTVSDVVDDVFRCFMSEGADAVACGTAREKVRAVSALLDELVTEHLGGYPSFLRSDYTSCKHGPPLKSKHPLYRIDSADDFPAHIHTLITECHEPVPHHGFFGAPRPSALAVREWLDIVAWTEELPEPYRNTEVRVFVEGGEVVEVYPYYHRSGLEDYLLRKARRRSTVLRDYAENYVPAITSSLEEIVRYAKAVAGAEGLREHGWSIDFALVEKNGRRAWYFIDMALASTSWRPRRRTAEDEWVTTELRELLGGGGRSGTSRAG